MSPFRTLLGVCIVAGFITYIYLNFDEIVEKQKVAVAKAEAGTGEGGEGSGCNFFPNSTKKYFSPHKLGERLTMIHAVHCGVTLHGPYAQAEQSKAIGEAQR